MKELIGKKIDKVYVSEGEHLLKFVSGADEIIYYAEGDCCSESWFADISGVDCLFGATVSAVEEMEYIDAQEVDNITRQEFDRIYGIKLYTNKGITDIVFRNSSNGYYGGWCNILGNKERETKLVSESKFVEITDDWLAGDFKQ